MRLRDYNLDSAKDLIKGWRFDQFRSTPGMALFKKGNYGRAILGANRRIVLCPHIDRICGRDTLLRRKVTDILTVVKNPIERLFALRIALDQVTLNYDDINYDGYIENWEEVYTRAVADTNLYLGFGVFRGWIDWNITDVPVSTITDVSLIIYVGGAYGAGDTVKITGFATTQINVTNYPDDETGNPALYAAIDSMTTLVAASADFQSTGSKTIDLGATADSQLQANLALDFWSIGFKGSDEAADWTFFASKENATSGNRPQLVVTYDLAPEAVTRSRSYIFG